MLPPTPHVLRDWKTYNKKQGKEKSGQRELLGLPSVLLKTEELCSEAHSPREQEQELGVTRSESILR